MPTFTDVQYANDEGISRLLDVYTPASGSNFPCILWVHGGGWYSGSKASPSFSSQVARGYALVSIDYRYSTVAPMPAQLHDVKAAIRWVKANAATYSINKNKICLAGNSAGGHLASLAAITGGIDSFEGAVGGNLSETSVVQALIDEYGPSDFVVSWPDTVTNPQSFGTINSLEALLLLLAPGPVKNSKPAQGAEPSKGLEPAQSNTMMFLPSLALASSPNANVGTVLPPTYICHGDADTLVPISQSTIFRDTLIAAGASVTYRTMPGIGHGSKDATATNEEQVFLDANLMV